MDRENQAQVVARLLQTVEQTRIAYQQAKVAYESAKDSAAEHPDSEFAIRQALRRENQTLLEYKSALTRFNRLILDGQLPDEAG
jgi:hypothetical protein